MGMIQNQEPLVSVIITTYNRADKVFKCLDSVLEQDYDHLEVIVVDDCSTDSTKDRFAEYSHQNVTYVRHAVNRRVAAATNTGFRHSRGRYIAAIGDDDVWTDPRKLQKQVNVFKEDSANRYGVVTCGVNLVMRNGRIPKPVEHPENLVRHILRTNGIIYGSAALVRRDVWEEVGGFDEKQKKGTDSDFYRRIILKGYDVFFMKEIMVDYDAARHGRMTIASRVESHLVNIEACRYVLKKHPHHFRRYKDAWAHRHLQIASSYGKTLANSFSVRYVIASIYHVALSFLISPRTTLSAAVSSKRSAV